MPFEENNYSFSLTHSHGNRHMPSRIVCATYDVDNKLLDLVETSVSELPGTRLLVVSRIRKVQIQKQRRIAFLLYQTVSVPCVIRRFDNVSSVARYRARF